MKLPDEALDALRQMPEDKQADIPQWMRDQMGGKTPQQEPPVVMGYKNNYRFEQCLRDDAEACEKEPGLKKAGNAMGLRISYIDEVDDLLGAIAALREKGAKAQLSDEQKRELRNAPQLVELIARDCEVLAKVSANWRNIQHTDLEECAVSLRTKLIPLFAELNQTLGREQGGGQTPPANFPLPLGGSCAMHMFPL